MENKLKEIYDLGKKAQDGNEMALVQLLEKKRSLINSVSNGNEDCYQHIIERLIKSIKKYKF